MMIRTLLAAALLVAFSTTAFAFHCPLDIKKIDEALAANPVLSDNQKAEVTELRAAGEDLHNGGKHYAALAALHRAMEIPEIKD